METQIAANEKISFRAKVRRFLNRPASASSVQPFYMTYRMTVQNEVKDPLLEAISARRALAH